MVRGLAGRRDVRRSRVKAGTAHLRLDESGSMKPGITGDRAPPALVVMPVLDTGIQFRGSRSATTPGLAPDWIAG